MAETNDPIAHLASLNLLPNSITMLNGRRYHQRHRFEANQWFKIPANIWNQIKDDTSSTEYDVNGNSYNMIQLCKWYLKRHFIHQLPRILTLERYYEGDGDIHYWKSNKIKRADNRIADNYPRYITDFDDGVYFGKPLKYGYNNALNDNDAGEQLLDSIKEFNNYTDTRHHDMQMGKDLLNTGRAYELEYVPQGMNAPKVKRIDPQNCFVIWSTDVDTKELCGVYYTFQRIENQYDYQVYVFTDDKMFQFDAGSDVEDGDWQLENTYENFFDAVPITEFILNDDRLGKWEPELDDIDSLDIAMSEMANSQEDFSNATLVISGAVKRPSDLVRMYDEKGRPIFYEHGHYQQINHLTTQSKDVNGNPNRPAYTKRHTDTKSNVMWLMPSTDTQGNVKSQPQMKYLTKQLDVNEWQTYINEVKSHIEKFAGIPNLDNKSGSGGNQNELEIMTRLLNIIENSSDFESNYRHGVIRRIHLLVNYLTKLPNGFTSSNTQNDPDDVSIHFDFNLPVDLQGTAQLLQILAQSGKFSNQTIRDVGSKLTGVSADEEDKLVQSENADQQQSNMAIQQSNFQNEAQSAGIGNQNLKYQSSSSSTVDSSSSQSDISDSNSSNSLNSLDNNSSGMTTSISADGTEVPVAQSNSSNSNLQIGSEALSQTTSILTSGSNSNSSQNEIGQGILASASSSAAQDSSMDGDSTIENATSFVDANGSVIGVNNPKANNMTFAALIMDSLYGANGGFPSGFDGAISSAIAQVASLSMANVSSSAPSDEDFDNPSDDLLDNPSSSDNS